MADSNTTTYSFTLPEVGASADSWGTKLNANWDKVDDLLDGTTAVDGINLQTFKIGGTTVSATGSELNFVSGVTSNIQTQLDSMVEKAGDTMTGDLSLGDGVKAKFGASDDLQIYHDSATNSSYISETGTGNLYIRGANLWLQNGDVTKTYALFTDGGASTLFHNDSAKIATTTTGVDVTGTVTADGLVVADVTNANLQLKSTGGNTYQVRTDTNEMYMYQANRGAPIAKFAYNGDVAFYEDTGTTAKFVWDSSSESLGIGTASPSDPLTIQSASNGSSIKLIGRASDGYSTLSFRNSSDTSSLAALFADDSSDSLQIHVNGSERARIDSSGNLLVGRTTGWDLNSVNTEGVGLTSTNHVFASRSAGPSGYFKRYGVVGNLVEFYWGTSRVGSISTNGNSVSYNTTSDERLKENIQDTTHPVDINDIQVREFDWKVDGSHQRYGFIAQELETVYPEAVHSPEDADEMKSVDYSKLVPLLVKEIQTLKAEIKELKA